MSFVEKSSWWGAFQRTLAREDKKSLIEYINQVVSDSMKAINDYKDTEFLADIVNSLSNCKTGLTNLRTTYQDYPDTVAQLRVIMRNIDIQLEKNISVLQGHCTDKKPIFTPSSQLSQQAQPQSPPQLQLPPLQVQSQTPQQPQTQQSQTQLLQTQPQPQAQVPQQTQPQPQSQTPQQPKVQLDPPIGSSIPAPSTNIPSFLLKEKEKEVLSKPIHASAIGTSYSITSLNKHDKKDSS